MFCFQNAGRLFQASFGAVSAAVEFKGGTAEQLTTDGEDTIVAVVTGREGITVVCSFHGLHFLEQTHNALRPTMKIGILKYAANKLLRHILYLPHTISKYMEAW